MKYNHIIFDLGGVLIELGELPFPRKSGFEIQKWFFSQTATQFERGLIGPDLFARQIKDEINLEMSNSEILKCFSRWPKRVFPGAKKMLTNLAKNYELTVLSNCNEIHWPIMERKFNILSYFHHTFSSHLIGETKPGRAVFMHVLDSIQADPGEVIFFDDNQVNIDSANKLGITGIKVNCPADVILFLRSNDLLM